MKNSRFRCNAWRQRFWRGHCILRTRGLFWRRSFENPENIFYQMNGLMLGTWLESALPRHAEAERRRAGDVSHSRTTY